MASGFYVDNHRSLYFVTARHVLFKEKVTKAKETLADLVFRSPSALLVSYPAQLEITTPKEIELTLDHLHKGNNIKFHATQDIVAIKIGDFIEDPKIRGGKLVKFVGGVKVKASPGDLLTVDINSVKTFKDVLVGNDVYIFGYPSSLGIQGITQIDYEKPLLRKGIVAGKNENLRTVILDCPVYYGNSGGPVVEVEEGAPLKFRVIGLVLQFVPFVEEWYNLKYRVSNVQIDNSGYSVVIPMDPVLDLLRD